MLYSIDDKEQTGLPKSRRADFKKWRDRLSEADYDRAVQGIREKCNGKGFVVSSFLPGADWTNTEFQPLYEACHKNEQHAAWFFGLIVWQTMIDDTVHDWVFLPPDKEGNDVIGMQYFIREQRRR